MYLTDIKWVCNAYPEAFIELQQYNTTENKFDFHELKTGKLLNYAFSASKKCIGYRGGDIYYECPLNNSLEGKKPRCELCESNDIYQIKMKTFQIGKDTTPHLLYLAYFEPHIYKIGTTSIQNKFKRSIEQDAIFSILIAQGEGSVIRDLESRISKKFNLTEQVNSKHKFSYLTLKPTQEKVYRIFNSLTDIYTKICTEYSNLSTYKYVFFLPNSLIKINWLDTNLIYYPSDPLILLENETNIYGTFLGLRGNYILFENDSKTYVVDRRYLIGRSSKNLNNYVYTIEASSQQLNLL